MAKLMFDIIIDFEIGYYNVVINKQLIRRITNNEI